ncbi:MAG TPA: Uma2 family endonuclease [Planctomycetota bacterium]|nr:Uma2 family endonuclease [Planctomycetota bacterium]
MQLPPLRVKLTYQDYLRIPDDGLRHELLDGVHVVTPSPESYHQELVARLVTELGLRVGRPRLGRVLVAPMDVLLSDNDVVQPDVLVVVTAHSQRIERNRIAGAPDLVIEVLSPSTSSRDRGEKKARYLATGVPECWLVDPVARTVTQFALRGDSYVRVGVHRDAIRLAILPEVTVDLAEVW